jgi:hypothetical protein
MADDNTDDTEDYSAPEMDPFLTAIALCEIAQRAKPISAALKKLRRVGRDIVAAEQKLAAVTAETEQKQAALAEREAAIDERARAQDAREDKFVSQTADVRDELFEHHAHLEQTNRVLIRRIMSTAGILGEWNETLQDLPTWAALRHMVAGLPDDLPAPDAAPAVRIDTLSDAFSDPHADRHGAPFLGSLSRSIEHKRGAT